jgi:hypothetical protein
MLEAPQSCGYLRAWQALVIPALRLSLIVWRVEAAEISEGADMCRDPECALHTQ